MKRPAAVITVIVAQFLIGGFFLGTGIFLLGLIIWPQVNPGVDAAASIHGLKVASVVLDPFIVLMFVSAFALLAGNRWGWWLALITDIALLAIFIYSMVDDGWRIDWDMAGVTTVSAIVPILLVLPTVRNFYWQSTNPAPLKLSS